MKNPQAIVQSDVQSERIFADGVDDFWARSVNGWLATASLVVLGAVCLLVIELAMWGL